MVIFTIGRVCYKSNGRDAGTRVVLVENAKDGFVMVEGLRKKRKCNVQHLIPTKKMVKLPSSYTKKEIMALLKEN